MAKIQSVEPNIADLAHGWLKIYLLNYKLEQESLNTEIDQALYDYALKNSGAGGKRPDATIMHPDRRVASIRSDGICSILAPSFMPSNLYLERAGSWDVDAG